MSLMGYTVKDIHKMQDCVVDLIHQTHESDIQVQEGLDLISSLLEGLLEEGRV